MITLTLLFYIYLIVVILAAILRFVCKATFRLGLVFLPIYGIYRLIKEAE